VRAVRRNLDRLARWPSNPDAHLALGIAYFELELGDDALAEFAHVQRLAPQRYEGFALAALEYLYRKDYARALQAWQPAQARNPELPPFGELLPRDHLGG
jgi:tetratricopeptide (TPR) repeat protein